MNDFVNSEQTMALIGESVLCDCEGVNDYSDKNQSKDSCNGQTRADGASSSDGCAAMDAAGAAQAPLADKSRATEATTHGCSSSGGGRRNGCCGGSGRRGSDGGCADPDEEEYDKCRQLYDFDNAPLHLRFNPFIRSGYRGLLSTQMCLESVFWWTNETINIWSHLFGYLLFLGLTLTDLALLQIQASMLDKLIVGALLGCFQACMILSSMYHTFSCRSEHDYKNFLAYDLFGISLSLFAIYMSGIYYAFWCLATLKYFYMITVSLFFAFAMLVQLPRFGCSDAVKMLTFVVWAGYGVIPTIHWTIEMGGMENPMVKLLLPRVLGMYLISGLAFLIYLTRIPERWFAGRVDYLGHSHQWWHVFVVLALYYWHNSGMVYIDYRMHHACPESDEIIPIIQPLS